MEGSGDLYFLTDLRCDGGLSRNPCPMQYKGGLTGLDTHVTAIWPRLSWPKWLPLVTMGENIGDQRSAIPQSYVPMHDGPWRKSQRYWCLQAIRRAEHWDVLA